jgi:predicted DNA-binding transcriptional regulator YafY
VRFDRAVARYVKESVWHPSQRLTPEADGGLIAEFDLSDTAEIKSWISSFGRRAEVLAPAALRRDVIADLQAQLALYKKLSPGKAKSAPR